jgi:hypothetical protein
MNKSADINKTIITTINKAEKILRRIRRKVI